MDIKISFTKAKETKGTWAYVEDGPAEGHKVGSLYIKKPAVAELGNPESIELTIKAKK